MGKIKKPLKVKLIISALTNDDELIEKVKIDLSKLFGEIEEVSEKFIFNHTKYYEPEMGENLFRRFIVFKNLKDREHIAYVKVQTNKIEEKYSINNKRQINLDPGYISLENFILFTTKNYTHRIYLENGIYADLTLIFQNKNFQTLSWTYPDYSEEIIRNYLKIIRDRYREQLKKENEYR